MPWFSHIMPLKLLGLSLSLNSVFVLLHLLISETGCTEQVVDEEQGWHRTQFSICHQPSVHSLESPLDSTEIKQINPKGNQHNIYWKDWCWNWSSTTSTTWCKEPTHWKRPWCWAKLKVGGDGDGRRWDGWIASPTWWTWVWIGSGSWWWTEKSGMLQSMGTQRAGHDWATELNWTGIWQSDCLNNLS